MEAVEVESKGSHGGDQTSSSSKKKKDRRSSWGCAFLLVSNCFQYTAYFGVSTNLVNYLKVQLHSGTKAAANSVTNWQGTGSITPLAAAFLADSFLGRYWTITIFLLISVAGYGVVTASASAALESAVFYAGLYLVALGSALQPVLSSFGADQFDVGADEEERGRQSSFFNWFYLTVNVGSLVGGTVLVWVQSAHGWQLGYGIPALLSVVAPPGGSPLTRIAQVVVAAARKCDVEAPADAALLHELDGDDGMSAILGSRRLVHTDQFRSVLDKAAVETAGDKARAASPWRLCTVTQVEELGACSGCCRSYTQMSTTFILQGDTLDPRIGSFRRHALVPLYDRAVVLLARRLTGHRRGFTQLARMGVGFVILTAAMLAAGTLEVARRRVVRRHGTTGADGAEYVPMSIFWQVPQYVVVGAAEVFTFIGQMEFFYDQAPDAMRSVCSGLSSAAAAARWIPDDINDGHLDYFFWLLAMLCIGNFGAYILVARWYSYKKTAD
ncbi:hypothetical protein ZWY2020_035808 [Hordeum vulgare]|nr:hypothetical protein ZWY2020_035808 [Hordeum vulgare]